MEPTIEPPLKCAPINATWFRRTTTLCAIALLRRIRSQRLGILFLASGICVKYGSLVSLAEAATLEYVRQHTAIPVPKVYCAFEHGGKKYIVMEKLPGKMLAGGWRQRSQESQMRILDQLKGMIDELRALKSPFGTAVANVHGGSLTDPRLPGLGLTYPVKTSHRFGPFEGIRAFHRWLRRPVEEAKEEHYPDLKELIGLHEDTDWGLPLFTHGDLSSLNILVKDDKVTGIVDWETSGWYPYYWEYTTALQVNPRNEFWAEYIDRFLTPLPAELRMERIRQKYFGDF